MFGLAPDSPEAGPETVASMVSYLASPEAHFVTGLSTCATFAPTLTLSQSELGQTILVNGGTLMD